MHNHDICYFNNSTIFQRANIMHTDNNIIMLLADLLAKHRRVQYFFHLQRRRIFFLFCWREISKLFRSLVMYIFDMMQHRPLADSEGGGMSPPPLLKKQTNKKQINTKNKWRRKKTAREKRGSVSSPQIIIITCKSVLIFLHHTFHKHLRQ